MNSEKSQLRARLKQFRLETSVQEVAVKSRQIVAHLEQAVDWSKVRNLHCFEPIALLNEVDVKPLLKFLKAKYPQTELYTSRKQDDEWQIVRMKDGQRAGDVSFDAIIVPMLGFDGSLHRIGYGGGYYDRLLTTQPQARKIGVCFEQGRINRVPSDSHDIPMDNIVTESF